MPEFQSQNLAKFLTLASEIGRNMPNLVYNAEFGIQNLRKSKFGEIAKFGTRNLA